MGQVQARLWPADLSQGRVPLLQNLGPHWSRLVGATFCWAGFVCFRWQRATVLTHRRSAEPIIANGDTVSLLVFGGAVPAGEDGDAHA